MNRQKFLETYTKYLRNSYEANPGIYSWPLEQLGAIEEKMVSAMVTGEANLNSDAIRNTCNELGIRTTGRAIRQYLGTKEGSDAK